jgi:hypothetical protein
MNGIDELVERYMAIWNEPDARARRWQIAALWTEDAAHFTPSMEVHGHTALEQRVTTAWEKWVRDTGHTFRSCRDADSHHGGVKFHWEMVTPSGEVSSLGFDFLVLSADGRIASDHQFLEPAVRRA